MDTQAPRLRPQGTWIPPLLACKFFLSLRRVATDSRCFIDPWMFYWTLNLLSTFPSKQSHSDLLFHIQTPSHEAIFPLGIFHAVRESIFVSCRSPPPVHRSLWPQPSASIWWVPPNPPSLAHSWISLYQLSSQLTDLNAASQHTPRENCSQEVALRL